MEYRNFLKQMQRDALGETIKRCTFDNFVTDTPKLERIKQRAIEFANDPFGRCLFIGGQSGSGKTHICTAALCKMAQAQGRLFGKRARYIRWLDIIRQYNADGADKNAIIEVIRACDVLYIDDFLKVQQGQIKNITQAASNLAFSIVDIFEKKPSAVLIISSELTEPELQAVDEALHGRICALATKKYCINVSKDKESNYRLK